MGGTEQQIEGHKKAVEEWKRLLGSEQVNPPIGITSVPVSLSISCIAVVAPKSRSEVEGVIRIAAEYGVSIYPISQGYNFGYGGPNPVESSCCVMDLSRMNAIQSFDERLGLITVEPGVSTGQVQRYLAEKKTSFLAPTLGIGPRASLIGSVLEKGRSGTPYVDRMESLMSLEAVLADGSVYRSSSETKLGTPSFFKWGVGPYLDGIFAQSGMGVVTSATFALAPKPDRAEVFSLSLSGEGKQLTAVVEMLRSGMNTLGDAFPVFSLQSKARIETRDSFATLGNKEKALISDNLGEWTLFGAVQGDRAVVRAAKRRIRKEVRAYLNRDTIFFDARELRVLGRMQKYLKHIHAWKTLATLLPKLSGFLRSVEEGILPFPGIDLQKGMLIIPVVLPMLGDRVAMFDAEARVICANNQQTYIATILNFSSRCVFFSLFFSFEQHSEEDRALVYACHDALIVAAKAQGGYVYRASVDTMEHVVETDAVFWRVAEKIKVALDPSRVISPGRYGRKRDV